MTTVNLVFLLLKTVFDCVSRLLIYSTFMFVVNEGQFSTLMTVKVYYATFAVLVIFNTIINTNEQYCSAKTWIGKSKKHSLKQVLNTNLFTIRNRTEFIQQRSFL